MGSNNEPFGGDFLLLKAEEAGVVDLLLLLFKSNLNDRRFIECPQELEFTQFRRRWILFVSVVFQKIAIASKGTLSHVGHSVEMWLNLLSANGGFITLLFNTLKGSLFSLLL